MAKCLGVSVVCPGLFKQPKTSGKCQLVRVGLKRLLSLLVEIQINLAYVFICNRTGVGVPLECDYPIRLLIVISIKPHQKYLYPTIALNPYSHRNLNQIK